MFFNIIKTKILPFDESLIIITDDWLYYYAFSIILIYYNIFMEE